MTPVHIKKLKCWSRIDILTIYICVWWLFVGVYSLHCQCYQPIPPDNVKYPQEENQYMDDKHCYRVWELKASCHISNQNSICYSDYNVSRSLNPSKPHFAWRTEIIIVTVHRQQDFPSGSVGKESACNAGDTGDTSSIPGSGRSPEGENGNPFQYPCLINPIEKSLAGHTP